LVLIPTDHVVTVWWMVEDFIERAVGESGGVVTTQDHFDKLVTGDKQLWVIWDGTCRAAVVTQIIKSVCFIWAVGGEGMKDWLHLLDDLEGWARKQGCTGMQLWGRPGWMRALNEYGYERKLVIMNKELKP
jgi:hypothetical protein